MERKGEKNIREGGHDREKFTWQGGVHNEDNKRRVSKCQGDGGSAQQRGILHDRVEWAMTKGKGKRA